MGIYKKGVILIILAGVMYGLIVQFYPFGDHSDRHAHSKIQVVNGGHAEVVSQPKWLSSVKKVFYNQESFEEQQIEAIKNLNSMINKVSGGRGAGVFIIADNDQATADKIKDQLRGIRTIPAKEVASFQMAGKPGGIKLKGALGMPNDSSLFIKPSVVAGTELEQAAFVGYLPGGTYLESNKNIQNPVLRDLLATEGNRTGWTGLSRVFDNVGTLGRVILDETDVASGHMVVTTPQSAINYQIGNHPAMLSRAQDADGNGMTSIKWIEGKNRIMEIKAGKTDQKSIDTLTDIANSIARKRG